VGSTWLSHDGERCIVFDDDHLNSQGGTLLRGDFRGFLNSNGQLALIHQL
jgi:hypothetical protein